MTAHARRRSPMWRGSRHHSRWGATCLKFMMSVTREMAADHDHSARIGAAALDRDDIHDLGRLRAGRCRSAPASRSGDNRRILSRMSRCAIVPSAAPMPRMFDVVSDKVWRVPTPTSCVIVACSSSALTRAAIKCNCGCGRPTVQTRTRALQAGSSYASGVSLDRGASTHFTLRSADAKSQSCRFAQSGIVALTIASQFRA